MAELGLVVNLYGRHTSVEIGTGCTYLCQSSRRLKALVGDSVECEPNPDGTGTLAAIRPRASVLTRVDARGRRELVAANLTQLVAVVAPEPAPDWNLVDRYLAAAELIGIAARIVVNKAELLTHPWHEIDDYAAIGYASTTTSAREPAGVRALGPLLRDHTSVLVGQSGVGKSTLLNALIGSQRLATQALSAKSGQGRHTTTSSSLHHLHDGGDLIDSPGVRSYAPYIDHERDVSAGYREFRQVDRPCRFDDCRHVAEPDCAVKQAVRNGSITRRRYDSYVKTFALVASLRQKREN